MGADLSHENRHTYINVTTLIVSLHNRTNLINNIHILTGSEHSLPPFLILIPGQHDDNFKIQIVYTATETTQTDFMGVVAKK